MLQQELLAQIKGYRITIKNLHLRYEDDFFVAKPYSIGLIFKELTCDSVSDTIECFQKLRDF
jgi:hypothetical protein